MAKSKSSQKRSLSQSGKLNQLMPTKRSHYISLFVITFVVINIIAITVVCVMVSNHKNIASYQLSPSDMILLDEAFSSYWCTGQTISANSKMNLTVYKIDKPIAKYNQIDKINIFNVNETLDSLDSKVYRFFMLQESSIRISGCAESLTHLRLFVNSTISSGCADSGVGRCPSKNIVSSDMKVCPQNFVVQKNVNKNSFVYIQFQNINDHPTKIKFNVTLQRVLYDVNQMKLACMNEESCNVPLDSEEQLVLLIPAPKRIIDSTGVIVTAQCHVRIAAGFGTYFSIVIPVIVALGIVLFLAQLKNGNQYKDLLKPLLNSSSKNHPII